MLGYAEALVTFRARHERRNPMRILVTGAVCAALFMTDLIALPADAAPAVPTPETLSPPSLITPIVTAVGVAHRSARRTARRVERRHGY